jgi:hypothetical protein
MAHPEKYKIFCTLHFIASLCQTIGLSVSIFELHKFIDKEWAYLNYITVGCIASSLLVSTIKDSLLSNPKIFMTDEELEALPRSPVL